MEKIFIQRMSILTLAGIGIVILLILSLGIYFITRKLAMQAIYGSSASPTRGVESPSEPLYETPMPRKIVEPAEGVEGPVKNPLIEFIKEWEEPKPKEVRVPKPAVKAAPTKKPAKKAEKKAVKKPSPKPKKKEVPTEEQENPLLKFIEEWEEPTPESSKEK